MRGLSRLERRALIVEPHSTGEFVPGHVFHDLVAVGRAHWVPEEPGSRVLVFAATAAGELALRVCPVVP